MYFYIYYIVQFIKNFIDILKSIVVAEPFHNIVQMRSGKKCTYAFRQEKVDAARWRIIKFLCANEIIREAVEMSGQESRTCRSFPSIGTCSLFDGKHPRRRCEYKWTKEEWRRIEERSPLTSRQSEATEVSMTPVRETISRCCATRRGETRCAPPLKRRNYYYDPSCGSKWKYNVRSRFLPFFFTRQKRCVEARNRVVTYTG